MANIKRIKKDLVKLSKDDLKDVLDFLMEDEEETPKEEEPIVEEKKKEVVTEVKEEDKKEEEETVTLTKDEVAKMIADALGGVVTQVNTKLDEVTKKAKPFGVTSKTPPPKENKNEKTAEDYLQKLNNSFR